MSSPQAQELKQLLSSKRQDNEGASAGEEAPCDTSYDVFHKQPAVYTPISVANTTPTASMSQSLMTDSTTPNGNNQHCIHRKWEELAQAWKTTAAGAPDSLDKQPNQLGGILETGENGNGQQRAAENNNNQLMRLSPLSSTSSSVSSLGGRGHVTSTNYLLHSPVLTMDTTANTSSPTSSNGQTTPNRPFRPYGFEWNKSSTPQSRGARTSRLEAYTNMCVFDRLYGQAPNTGIPKQPHPTPNREKTPATTRRTAESKSPSAAAAAVAADKKKKKSPPTIYKQAQPWKASSIYPRSFGRAPPPLAGTGKGKTQMHGTISIPVSPTPSPDAKMSSPKQRVTSIKTNKQSSKPKSSKSPTTKTRDVTRSLSPVRHTKRSTKKNNNRSNARSQSPTRSSKDRQSWSSPGGRTPRSFHLRSAVGKAKVDEESLSMIQLRMQRTKMLKQISGTGYYDTGKNRKTKTKKRSNQPQSGKASAQPQGSPLSWSTPSAQRLQHPLDSSSAQKDLATPEKSARTAPRSLDLPSLMNDPQQTQQEQSDLNVDESKGTFRTSSAGAIVTPDGGQTAAVLLTPTPSQYTSHAGTPSPSNSPLAEYSPTTAAGAQSTVQSAYRESHYSVEQRRELVAIFRQERKRVQEYQGLHQQKPQQQQLKSPVSPSPVSTSSTSSPLAQSPLPDTPLRAKWKAKQPVYQRHIAAKLIQQWYRRRQGMIRKLELAKQKEAHASRTIQLRWRSNRKRFQKLAEDRKAAEMLKLCWWRKLDFTEATRIDKATSTSVAQHAYSHIPQQIQNFVRGSRERQAAEASGARLLQLCWWRDAFTKDEEERMSKIPSTCKLDKIPQDVRIFVLSSRERKKKELQAAGSIQQCWRRHRKGMSREEQVPRVEPVKAVSLLSPSLAKQQKNGEEVAVTDIIAGEKEQVEPEAILQPPVRESSVQQNNSVKRIGGEGSLLSFSLEKSESPSPRPTQAVRVPLGSPVKGRGVEQTAKVGGHKRDVQSPKSKEMSKDSAIAADGSQKQRSTARDKGISPPSHELSSNSVIDLDRLYRQAFSVRKAALWQRRKNRIQAAKKLQKWWKASLLVCVNLRRRRRSATKLQAVYRGHRCSLVFQHGRSQRESVQQRRIPVSLTSSPRFTNERLPLSLVKAKRFAWCFVLFAVYSCTLFTFLLFVALCKFDGIISIKKHHHIR